MQPEDPNRGREPGSPSVDPTRTANGQTGPSRTGTQEGELTWAMILARLRSTLGARDERGWATLAHLSVLLWLVLGLVGGVLTAIPWLLLGPMGGLVFATITVVLLPAAPFVIWLMHRGKSAMVRFHAAQALWYQVACIVILGVGWYIAVQASSSAIGFLLVPVMSLASFVPLALGCYAAYRVHKGFDYRYPVVADVVDRGIGETTSRLPTSHPFLRPRPENVRREVLAGSLAAAAVAGTLVVLIYIILGLAGVFDIPLMPFNIGLATFSSIHGGAATFRIPPIPFTGLSGGYFRAWSPALSLALLPTVAMLILGRIFARQIGATIVFAGAAAFAYAVLVFFSAALGAYSVGEMGVTLSLAPGPFSTAARAFLLAGLGAFIGAATVHGPLLPARVRQVIKGAFAAVGVSLAITLVLTLVLAIGALELAGTGTTEFAQTDSVVEDEATNDSTAQVVALIVFTWLPTILGTLWLFAHGLSLGLQDAANLSTIPMIGQLLAEGLAFIPSKVSLLGTWPFGGMWRLLLLGPLAGFVAGGAVAAREALPGQRWWQGALMAVPYTVFAAFVSVLFCRITFDLNVEVANPNITLGTPLFGLLVLLPVGGGLGALGGLLSKNVSSSAPPVALPALPPARQGATLGKDSPRDGVLAPPIGEEEDRHRADEALRRREAEARAGAKTSLMPQQLASIRGIMDLSPRETLDEVQRFLTRQGYEVMRRADYSLSAERRGQQFFLPDSTSTFTSTLEVLVHPEPGGGVRMKIWGQDSDPVPWQQQAQWKEWADSLPKKMAREDASSVADVRGHEAKDAASEKDISDLLERFEAAEDRLGVRLEGLFARRDGENGHIHLNGELHASNDGGELSRDIEVVATLHDSSGRVVQKRSTSFHSGSFFGFEAFSLSMQAGGNPPPKIRVYPKAL